MSAEDDYPVAQGDGDLFTAEHFTCPQCQMTSYNPNDIREGYCGNCHSWTGHAPSGKIEANDSASGATLNSRPAQSR